MLHLENENNFFAHLFYAEAFYSASGADVGPYRSVRFSWRDEPGCAVLSFKGKRS